ncbi:MAG: ISL3 family transposase [Verrucomicrobiales bacterium]|nr:ISL3 family transposase [Verrucomicrobiales bacterium]
MTAKDLEQMLGLVEPWQVTSLEIDPAARTARLRVECAATTWAGPATGEALHIHGWQERTWRHLDFWQYETLLVAKVPRVRNPMTDETMDGGPPIGPRWKKRCRLEAMKKLGESFKASLPRWLNGFAHPIRNALAEGFNRVIQAIKSAARGFRNFAHDCARILFLLGNLDPSLP